MFLSTAINIWLLVITILTLRLIRRNMNEMFKSEMMRINFIYWSFIVSYTSWMFFDMLQMITPNNDGTSFLASQAPAPSLNSHARCWLWSTTSFADVNPERRQLRLVGDSGTMTHGRQPSSPWHHGPWYRPLMAMLNSVFG